MSADTLRVHHSGCRSSPEHPVNLWLKVFGPTREQGPNKLRNREKGAESDIAAITREVLNLVFTSKSNKSKHFHYLTFNLSNETFIDMNGLNGYKYPSV